MTSARLRAAHVGLLMILVGLAFGPLLTMVLHAGASEDLIFAGADGPFPADQFQYFAWIRQYGSSLLADNDLDLASSDRVFLHPMFLLSGMAVRLGLSVELAFQIWKPVAVAALFVGVRGYVRHFLARPEERAAALAMALFFASPAIVVLGDRVLGATGEMFPTAQLWGYLPAAISVGLMPLYLLAVEGLDRRGALATACACGAIVSWLHPWQGQVLLVTVVAAVVLRRDHGLPYGRLAVACTVTLAPLVYYFALSLTDGAWELAAEANEAVGRLPAWTVAAALLPIALPAAFGVRRPDTLGEAMLLAWPPSAVLVFLFLSPSFAQHALEGVSIPLAVLAARGLARMRRPALTMAAVAVLVVPGTVYILVWFRDTVGGGTQGHYVRADEQRALSALDADSRRGGVLTSPRLGTLVPSATGRRSWVGHPSWTHDYDERALQSAALFAGELGAERGIDLVRSSGARVLLVDCNASARAVADLWPVISASRTYGCASAHRIELGSRGRSSGTSGRRDAQTHRSHAAPAPGVPSVARNP